MALPDPDRITTRQEFADALTRLREQASLTVRDIARAVGVPHSTVGGYLSGRHLPPVGQTDLLTRILCASGVTDPDSHDQWRAALERVRRVPGPRPAGSPAPYRGLASFEPDDADWFFGRTELTRAVLARLGDSGPHRHPVVVVGPSGAGKSSLLRAGVVPAVRAGALGGGQWTVRLLVPGSAPLAALAQAQEADPGTGGLLLVVDQLEEVFTECRDEAERQEFLAALIALARDGAAVLLGLRADFYHRALSEPLLVPVLQHSQVAVGPMTEAELREAIVGPARRARLDVEEGLVEVLLRDLAPPAGTGTDTGVGAHEVGALPLLSHALRATWERCTRNRLTLADYRATGGIRGAVAATADAAYEALTPADRGLARRLFVALVRIGEETPNTRRRLTRAERDALGSGGTEPDRLAAVLDRFVTQRLITVDADTVEITHEALVAAWPRLRRWIAADRRGLLIGQQLHDTARQWQREQRDPALLYRGTRLAAAREWAEPGGRPRLTELDREFLHASGRRERRRTRVLQQTVAALAGLLLLAAGGGAYALQQRGEAEAQRTVADQERNLALSRMVAGRADRLRDTDPALAAQLSLAAYQIAPTVEARSSLLSSSALPAVTRQLGPDGILQSITLDPRHSLLAAAGADGSVRLWDVTDPLRPVARATTLPGFATVAEAVAFHPGGRLLAVAGIDGTGYLYDVSDPAAPSDLGVRLAGSDDPVLALAFSPDGTVLASGGQEAAVRLWDVTEPAAAVPRGEPLRAPADTVTSVAFSPDGAVLAAGGHDRAVHRWDVTDPAAPVPMGEPLTGPEGAIFGVAFAPDGTALAAASTDKRVYLWDQTGSGARSGAGPDPESGAALADPAVQADPTAQADPTVLAGPTSWLHKVAFSPDGQTVAAGSSDGQAWLWDRASGAVIATLPHAAPVTGVTFAAAGDALYSSAADGTVRRWRLPGPVMAGATDTVHDVVHHPELPIVAAASGDGGVYLWDVTDPQLPVLLELLTSPEPAGYLIGTVAISPDGSTLAAGGLDGTVWRWDLTDPQHPARLEPPLRELTDFAEGLAFSPDGRLLAGGAADGTLRLWDLTDPGRPRTLGDPMPGPRNFVYAVAFSPDGTVLAAAGFDLMVWLYDVTDPGRPVPLGQPLTGPSNFIYSVAFSPDGDTLVVGSADETVRLWDVADPAAARPGPVLTGPEGYVTWAEFSPDGRRLAAASTDHTVWLWDTTGPGAPAPYAILTGTDGPVQYAAFGPGGDTLVGSSQDTTVRHWHIRTDDVAGQVCAVTGDPVTANEWNRHVPGLPYQPPCEHDTDSRND